MTGNEIHFNVHHSYRYFKAKPESQKLFPAIANVSITDLPTNHDFLNSAFTCVNSLNYLIPYLKNDHPERCPSFPKQIKDNYNEVDVKVIGIQNNGT